MKCERCGKDVSFCELHKDPRPEYATTFGKQKEICEDCMGWNGKENIPVIKESIYDYQ